MDPFKFKKIYRKDLRCPNTQDKSRVERKTMVFLKPLFKGNLDPFVNNANLGAVAHTSNGT